MASRTGADIRVEIVAGAGGASEVSYGGYNDIITGTLTRGANVTPYDINDEVATPGTAPLSLALGRAVGRTGLIASCTLIYSSTPAIIPQFRLLLFDRTLTLAGDNAPINISDAHALFGIGFIDFDTYQTLGGTTAAPLMMAGQMVSSALVYKPEASVATIFAALITRNAFTPIANSETITLRLGVDQN